MAFAAVAGGATAAVVGGLMNGGRDGGGGGSAPAPSHGIFDVSPDTIASTVAALTNAQNANPTEAEKQQLDSLKRSNEIAGAMWDRYKQVYQPLQDKVIQDATNVDSEANQEAAAGRANADVTGQFEQKRQANLERLRSLGVNPNSGAFIEANSRLAGQEAGANVGAQTGARQNLMNVGRQYRASVAGTGAAMPQQSMSGFTSNASGLGSAATGIRTGRGVDNKAMGAFLSPIVGGIGRGVSNWFGTSDVGSGVNSWLNGGTYSQQGMGFGEDGRGAYDNELSYDPASNPADSGYSGDFAFANGGVVRAPRRGVGYADGGKVAGPGTGTSDSIPVPVRGVNGGYGRAYLSDGEFVVPADVVKAKGTEFFNKMIETYHTPVRRGVHRR